MRDHRESPIGEPPFPQVTVTLDARRHASSPGTEKFSARNAHRPGHHRAQRRLHAAEGASTRSPSARTTSSSNLKNLFIRDNFGTYMFTSLDNFEARPGAAATTAASRRPAIRMQPAAFKVRQWGFYAGDSWRARSEHDGDLRRPRRRADVPDQAERQPARGRQLRLRHRRRAEPGRVVAARRASTTT